MSTEAKTITKLRDTISRVLREEQVPLKEADAARETIRAIYKEASEHGLKQADVLRSVLTPVLEARTYCNCPTCVSRRKGNENT